MSAVLFPHQDEIAAVEAEVAKPAPLACPHCDRRFPPTSEGWSARYQHAKAKHKGRKMVGIRFRDGPFYEPSMGELLVQAQIDHACGGPVDHYLREMFPDTFKA